MSSHSALVRRCKAAAIHREINAGGRRIDTNRSSNDVFTGQPAESDREIMVGINAGEAEEMVGRLKRRRRKASGPGRPLS